MDGPGGGAVLEFKLFEKYTSRIRSVLESQEAEGAKSSGWGAARRTAGTPGKPSYSLRFELTVDGQVIPEVLLEELDDI